MGFISAIKICSRRKMKLFFFFFVTQRCLLKACLIFLLIKRRRIGECKMYDMIRSVQEMGPVGQPCICNRQITFPRNDFLHLKLQLLPKFQMF